MFNATNQEFLVCGIINLYFIPNYIPNIVLLFWLRIRIGFRRQGRSDAVEEEQYEILKFEVEKIQVK